MGGCQPIFLLYCIIFNWAAQYVQKSLTFMLKNGRLIMLVNYTDYNIEKRESYGQAANIDC